MSATTTSRPSTTLEAVTRGRRRRQRSRLIATGALLLSVLVLFAIALMVGDRLFSPGEVVRVVLGESVPGASFTVGELRFPRATLSLLAGAAFGLGGVTFQTMLRNPLASPDIIGITAGASAAAAIAIVYFQADDVVVSVVAVLASLATALLIYVLAYVDGMAGTRLILIGIGIAAILKAVVSYALASAAAWDLQTAMRWLTGSVNGATWEGVAPLAVALLVIAPILLGHGRSLRLLQQGDDAAAALGVDVERTRLVAILSAVGLIAFATAAAGPVAFVAFLAGPIAAGIVRAGGSLMVPAALVGSLLVLGADMFGQFAFDTRYPVGVITGVLGAPYLVYLLIRTNRSGGSL
ncbi:MAG: iron chelate uptake ABC transporter family permease subunit [Mobilicoccus sp.]|nr:iron chelate uptake ABC transporter family permease subunit [Mobilicoccus sp.]